MKEVVLFIRRILWCPIYWTLSTAGHMNKCMVMPYVWSWTHMYHYRFSHNHLKTSEMGWNKLDADNHYTCCTCSWPSTTSWAHTTNLTRIFHDEVIHAVVADFVWNTLVQVFRTSIKLPGDSARWLSGFFMKWRRSMDWSELAALLRQSSQAFWSATPSKQTLVNPASWNGRRCGIFLTFWSSLYISPMYCCTLWLRLVTG